MQCLLKKLAAGFLCLFCATSTPSKLSADSLSPSAESETPPYITADHAQSIYRHLLANHWVPETGLFISFLGTGDHKLVQQASTYEQAAVGLLAVRMGDVERAQGIFRFLKTAWLEGPLRGGREGVYGLANFYNAEFGGDGIEKTIHVGPNAWAGLFAANLGNMTGNKEASAWALQVARWIAQDVPHREGGVAMGPLYGPDDIPWPKIFSTENNISYYALLSEVLRTQDLDVKDREWLIKETNGVEDWLVTQAFDRLAYTMNRGITPHGPDRIRALDTITWLVSALGPQRLAERGIDPDRLMRQAEKSFEVKVQGQMGVDPTDQPEADLTFALTAGELVPHRGTPRLELEEHRMIWHEGLAGYINTLNTMANYAQQQGSFKRALKYAEKARELTEEFDLAALKNYPPGTAYPYATYGKFFHDGWYPPMDSPEGPPSSLIAGVWRCFSGLGIDPLAGRTIEGVPTVTVSLPKVENIAHTRPSILYGTSEDMVVHAWQSLDHGDIDHAIQQAQATIREWSPWALKLQEKKLRKVGHLVEYSGLPDQRKQIFSFWALNDVAAAYFILGKAFDQKSHYSQAAGAFQQIVLHYSLAQIWDPRGWFWSPLDSVRDEYVASNPRYYAEVLPQMLAAASSLGKLPN